MSGTAVLALTSTAGPATAQQPPTTPRLELVEQDLAVTPDGTVTLVYRLTGVADDALDFVPDPPAPVDPAVPVDPLTPPPVVPEPAPLAVEVTNYRPLTDPDDVRDLVGSDVDPDAFTGAVDGIVIDGARDLATVEADGSVTLRIPIPTDVVESVEDRLKMATPGIYPLRVRLLAGDAGAVTPVTTAGTVVQRLPGPGDAPAPPPIDLSIVTVTPAPGPDARTEERANAEQALDDAITLAATVPGPVTLEVPPALVAARAATPEGASALAAALDGDELVALPIVPLDVSSAAAADRGDLFARFLSAGQDVLTTAVPSTPSRRDVWIVTEPLSGAGAQQLRDTGVRFVVMPAALYRETVGPPLPRTDLFVDAELPDGDALPLLLVGPLAAELTPESADEILADATATEWAIGTLAELLVEQSTATGEALTQRRSLILTTPDLLAPDPRLITALQQVATTTTALRFGPASALIGTTDTQLDDGRPLAVTLPEVAGPSLVERVARLDRTALTMLSAASMLPPGDPRPDAWAAELEDLTSTAYTDEEVAAATADLEAQAQALIDAVVLPDPFTFTLTGRSGVIELRLGNTSDEPLRVQLDLDSTKVEFPDGDQVVTLRPNDETSVNVPVRARSNGTSSIELRVATPAGQPIDEPVTLTSRVTGFTGLGYLLTGGLVLVLLSWWFTHVRARRRAALIGDGRDRHPATRRVGSDAL